VLGCAQSGADVAARAEPHANDDAPACGECVNVTESTPEPTPFDLIYVVENSAGMEDVVASFEAGVAEIVSWLGNVLSVSLRVIVISRHGSEPVGDSATPLCLYPELGGYACTPPPGVEIPLEVVHYSAAVRQGEAWCRLLETFAVGDERAADGARPGWQPVAPLGWGALLRPNTKIIVTFVGASDVACGPGVAYDDDYLWPDGPFPYSFDGRDAQSAEAAAAEFLQAWGEVTAQAASHTVFDAVGPFVIPSGARPGSDPVYTEACIDSAPFAASTANQELTLLTGGARWSTCSDEPIWQAQAQLYTPFGGDYTCTLELPPHDPADWERASLSLRRPGVESLKAELVGSAAECNGFGFYFDGVVVANEDPTFVELCPELCLEVTSAFPAELELSVPCAGRCD
jgi:hypothetical protein